jgi:hypothetical protein
MSHLNISLPGFGNTGIGARIGYPLRKLDIDLRVLTRAVLLALQSKRTDLTAEQAGQLVTDTQSHACAPDVTQGCRAFVSDAEYQRLVELGHWHHRRQRRRARLR